MEDEVIEALLSASGYVPELGACLMKRMVARPVEAPVAENMRNRLCDHDS